ncbi:MAG: phosphoglycolate phosphatase, partial [Thermoplasmatales archaeon]|nr:phosphoglycolate phosphatase [Thermoplasmatales archaeon]
MGVMLKSVVIDIDYTLTDNQRRISTTAVDAIRNVESCGVPVMLASGNVLPIAMAAKTYIGCSGPVIAENGGIVYYNGKVEILFDKKESEKAFEFLRDKLPVKRLFTDRWRITEVGLKSNVDVEDIKKVLKGWDVNVESTGLAIHIMSKGHDKFEGLKVACKWLSIKPENVAAIGDYENDAGMIRNSGFGVAVANASPMLKKIAKYVTEKDDGEGVAEALKIVMKNI